jgi:hypothetical protein
MPAVGLKPATPATERPQTYALDRAATGIGISIYILLILFSHLHLTLYRHSLIFLSSALLAQFIILLQTTSSLTISQLQHNLFCLHLHFYNRLYV